MKTLPAWMQALPMGGVFLVFFVMPLLLVGAVSFWPQNEYTLEPGFTLAYFVAFHVPSVGAQTVIFAVVLAFVHLNTTFMMVPIFNSMMKIDRSLIEAADDCGATAWQTLWNVIVPLCRTGILIGSIFVITLVMGDFVTVGVMGGQQIASVGKTIQVQTSYLQFPLAAANAVVLLGVVLLIIVALNRLVDLRKEL